MKKILLTIFLSLIFFSADLYAAEFLDAFLHINFGFSASMGLDNEWLKYEEESYYLTELYDDATTKEIHPTHNQTAFSLFLDIMPIPPIVFEDSGQALKFGIRGGYKFYFLNQVLDITETDGSLSSYGGQYFRYSSWFVGPILYYAPSVKSEGLDGEYTAKGGFTLFVLYGQLVDANLTAYPAKRNKGVTIGNYESSVTGYRLDFGIGGSISLGSLNLGVNLIYSYMSLTLSTPIEGYDSFKSPSSMNDFMIEIYAGIPLTADF